MRTFDDDETRGPRNSRDRRDNNKPKFNRNRDDRNSAPRERRNFDRDDDFKPRNNNKFNRDRKPRSFDEDMRNPDNRNFSGKKKDKASKYYDAPEYQKKHHDGHHGGKPAGKPERFRTKNYKDYDNFDARKEGQRRSPPQQVHRQLGHLLAPRSRYLHSGWRRDHQRRSRYRTGHQG